MIDFTFLAKSPTLVKTQKLTEDQSHELANIARCALSSSLLFSPCLKKTEEVTLERVLSFIKPKPDFSCSGHYLIQHEQKLIGYAHIWDGWLATEMDFTSSPVVEVAFIHPTYTAWFLYARALLTAEAALIEREREP